MPTTRSRWDDACWSFRAVLGAESHVGFCLAASADPERHCEPAVIGSPPRPLSAPPMYSAASFELERVA